MKRQSPSLQPPTGARENECVLLDATTISQKPQVQTEHSGRPVDAKHTLCSPRISQPLCPRRASLAGQYVMHVCVMGRDWPLLVERWHRRYRVSASIQSQVSRICTRVLTSPSTELSSAYYFRKARTQRTVHTQARPGAGRGGWGIGRKSRQGRTGLAPGRARGNLLPTFNSLSQPHSSSKIANRHLRYG